MRPRADVNLACKRFQDVLLITRFGVTRIHYSLLWNQPGARIQSSMHSTAYLAGPLQWFLSLLLGTL